MVLALSQPSFTFTAHSWSLVYRDDLTAVGLVVLQLQSSRESKAANKYFMKRVVLNMLKRREQGDIVSRR